MPYIDLAGLSRYASRQKERLERDCALLRDMQWLRTDKAGAVSFYPVGNSPLEATVDFLFTETGPAEGTKGPENPSTITGVSSVLLSKIGGKNLLAYNFSSATVPSGATATYNGITVTNNNGVFTFSGTASANRNIYITHTTEELNKLKIPAGTYTLSGFTAPADATSGTELRMQLYDIDGGDIQTISCANGSATFTINALKICNVYLRTASGTVYPSGFTCSPQLELGDTATAFEPSTVSDYITPLNSTYYGGFIDLATGLMTVTVYGEQISSFSYVYNAYSNTVAFRTLLSYPTAQIADSYYGVSDKFEFSGSNTDAEHWRLEGGGDGNRCLFFINKSRLDLSGAVDPSAPTGSEWVESANAWLADNPVFLVYGVATPTTVQLTPAEILSLSQPDKYTPRLNTVYTDAQAVQVGYVKSPIREEFELQQAVAAQGGNV